MRINVSPYILLCLTLVGAGSCNSSRRSAQNPANDDREFGIARLAESNNRFAMDLFKQIHSRSDNIIYSPYSITNIISMIYGGAAGETAAEISNVLYFPKDHRDLHPLAREVWESMDSLNSTGQTELKLANALWAQESFSFLPGYFDLCSEFYNAPIETLDFIQTENREKGRIRINNWISENTNRHINDLIPPGIIDENTRLVLTNAIYFNGKWMYPFNKSASSPSVFHVSQEESLETVYMNQTKVIPYYEDEEVQALSLPYEGGRMSMIVILPKRIEGWNMISSILDYDRIRLLKSKMTDTEVQIKLPRFKSELETNLRRELMAMGMENAFTKDADLSGMTGEQNLFISEIIHKAFIEVTEAGTEAAAASAALLALKSALEEEPVRFTADHPFIYLVWDGNTGNIIFAGRLVRPSEII